MPKAPKTTKTISLQYLKNAKDGDDFSLLIIVKCFFKVILSFLMCVARHAQITQNKKFVISLQYLKREVNDELNFLHAGKHENMLQIDTMILMEMVKHFESSDNSKFTMSLQYLKKEDRYKLIFCMQISIKVAFNTLDTKGGFLFVGNISRKLVMESIFCMQINTTIVFDGNSKLGG